MTLLFIDLIPGEIYKGVGALPLPIRSARRCVSVIGEVENLFVRPGSRKPVVIGSGG